MQHSFLWQVPEENMSETGERSHDFNFDLAVLGGGSGGLACAKEAAKLGAKVCYYGNFQSLYIGLIK